jgi:ATP-dependent Clp protease ATP-binding subunit ClpA
MTEPVPTPRFRDIVAAASQIATERGNSYVGVEHLFLAMIRDGHAVPTQVLSQRVDPHQAEVDLLAFMDSDAYKTSSKQREEH